MEVTSSSSIPELQTSKNAVTKQMQPHYNNCNTSPLSISPNIPERLNNIYHQIICCLKTHPAWGNKGLILCNIARTHRETHFKIYPRIRDHGQRKPWTSDVTTSGSSSYKCDTFIQYIRGEHKFSTPPFIWTNWKNNKNTILPTVRKTVRYKDVIRNNLRQGLHAESRQTICRMRRSDLRMLPVQTNEE